MNESKTPRADGWPIRATNLGLSTALEICQTCGAAQCPSQIESGECFYCISRQYKAERYAAKALCDTLAKALDSIAKWNLPKHYELDYGSNGAREYIKGVAERALVEWRAAK